MQIRSSQKGLKFHMRFAQVSAKNRPSPWNEDDFIEAYKRAVPSSVNEDNYDIAAVITISGYQGHAMMHYSYNRSRDGNYHTCYNFVSDNELRRYM